MWGRSRLPARPACGRRALACLREATRLEDRGLHRKRFAEIRAVGTRRPGRAVGAIRIGHRADAFCAGSDSIERLPEELARVESDGAASCRARDGMTPPRSRREARSEGLGDASLPTSATSARRLGAGLALAQAGEHRQEAGPGAAFPLSHGPQAHAVSLGTRGVRTRPEEELFHMFNDPRTARAAAGVAYPLVSSRTRTRFDRTVLPCEVITRARVVRSSSPSLRDPTAW